MHDRLASKLVPSNQGKRATCSGDALFDAWTYDKQPDGAMNLILADRGSKCLSGVHRSWVSLLNAGNDLIIEYRVANESMLVDLLTVLRGTLGKSLDRLVVIVIRTPLSDILNRERDSDLSKSNRYPIGFGLSTFKQSRSIHCIPSSVSKLNVEVNDGMPTDEVTEKVYRYICKAGLL